MMKVLFAALLLFALPLRISAHPQAAPEESLPPEGILHSIANVRAAHSGETLQLSRQKTGAPLELDFTDCQAIGVQFDNNQWWILPLSATGSTITANRSLWVLPLDPTSKNSSWRIDLKNGELRARKTDDGLSVSVDADTATLSRAEARPHSDPFGHRFSLDFSGGPELEQALAAFYWGTILPSVVEKTMAAHFPYHDGYVLSTLNVKAYAGSYPAVDHEFQIKGRLAMGSDADLDIVKRMIELQFKLMNDDPERLFRAPTSVQPDGRREYHVRRNSQDNRQNAAMFPLTGNIEVIEESWRYYEATKDTAWLRAHLTNLQHAADWILASTDQYGRVWSDVYYEDQVIKDGRVTQSQAFAAQAFGLLARIETLLGHPAESARFTAAHKKMASALVAPLPTGYWDPQKQRFVDWVDRDGKTHDHLHLLANELPVAFGYATPDQTAQVHRLLDANDGEFERFPSFVSARIADYTRSEIGSGGPYDLCAAGRYWYWDAAYRASQMQNAVLFDQLKKVAAEGAANAYYLSERYDMDHVYYVDGKDAHGAEKYYEYPNVFAAVLIDQLLGLSRPADADLSVSPRLPIYGGVEFSIPAYAVRYTWNQNGFLLKNLSDRSRTFKVDLSSLTSASAHFQLRSSSRTGLVGPHITLTLPPHAEAYWTPIRGQARSHP